MIKKLKSHYLKLGPRAFVIAAVISLLTLDVINSLYLRLYWKNKNISMLFVERLAHGQGLELRQLGNQTLMEVQGMVNNAFFFFLFIVIVNNLFFYGFYLRKKLWAQGYVLFYTFTNILLGATFLLEGPILGIPWFIYNITTIFLYTYLYLGVKVLKFETTDAILGDGKTGQ